MQRAVAEIPRREHTRVRDTVCSILHTKFCKTQDGIYFGATKREFRFEILPEIQPRREIQTREVVNAAKREQEIF